MDASTRTHPHTHTHVTSPGPAFPLRSSFAPGHEEVDRQHAAAPGREAGGGLGSRAPEGVTKLSFGHTHTHTHADADAVGVTSDGGTGATAPVRPFIFGSAGGASASGIASITAHTPDFDALSDARARSVGEREEAAAARRRFKFPRWRAVSALLFLLGGFALAVSGMALPSVAMGIVGALLFLPGAYMTYVYVQILRGNPAYMREQHRWMDMADEDGYN